MATTFLTKAPGSLQAWESQFRAEDLPILERTANEIEDWREIQEEASAHVLGEALASDPLMTLKLFAHLGRIRRGKSDSEPETVTAALLLMGIPPFFRAFEPQTTVESLLQEHPQALEGFEAVLLRSRRAANFALSFAVQRTDQDATVIYGATLLHDFAELLLWVKAPALAMDIRDRQRAEPTLRSADAQRQVLGITLDELQHALMLRWRIPMLLTTITNAQTNSNSAQVRNVQLAIRVARHSAQSWDNAALPDDVREIAELLQIGLEPCWRLLHDIDD